MVFVALITRDSNLLHILSRQFSSDYNLHCLKPFKSAKDVCAGLEALNYAGAVILDSSWQETILTHSSRPSLAASSAKAADTLVVTPAGIMADFVIGQAIINLLTHNLWDIKGASIVITGSDAITRVLAKELASMGANSIHIISESRPLAEQALPDIATTKSVAHVYGDVSAETAFERADLLIRTESSSKIPLTILGPHLSVIDLSPGPLSPLRQEALRVGAPSFGLRDLQAHQLSAGLETILGTKIDPEVFLMPLLSLPE